MMFRFFIILILSNFLFTEGINKIISSPSWNSHIKSPWGVWLSNTNDLYVTDSSAFKIWKINSSGEISTFAGTGKSGSSGDNGIASNATLTSPAGIWGGKTYLYFCDGKHVRKINFNSNIISNFAGGGLLIPQVGNSILATDMLLDSNTYALWGNQLGDKFFSNEFKIFKVNSQGYVTLFAGGGVNTGADGEVPATSLHLKGVRSISGDVNGRVFVSDYGNNVIRSIKNGMSAILLGEVGFDGSSFDDGSLANSTAIGLPRGLWYDNSGNILYYADSTNHIVGAITLSDKTVNRIVGQFGASNGPLNNGDGGDALDAVLNRPNGIWGDNSGRLWIADRLHNKIRQLIPVTESQTLFWNGATFYKSPSAGLSCNQVCSSYGLIFDVNGSQHTGNHVGSEWYGPNGDNTRGDGGDWVSVECSSTDNWTNWGANGATPDGNFHHDLCFLNCACISSSLPTRRNLRG